MAFAKKCKYGCNTLIVWRDNEGKFYEQDTNEQHTKDRCAAAQGKVGTTKQETFNDQKTNDIKAAQLERRNQHRELIITMKNLTKAIVELVATNNKNNLSHEDIESAIGFEQYREDQHSFQDEVV